MHTCTVKRFTVGPMVGIHLGRWEFRELEYQAIAWDSIKAIDIREWLIYRGGRLEGFYCIHFIVYTCKYVDIYMFL